MAKKAPKLTAEERAAMKETMRERSGANGEKEVLAKIKAMAKSDREMAERVHAIVKEVAPHLTAKTYYGMPAYARGEKVVVFFQDAGKFKARYSTLGFSDKASLDDGGMWPTSYALMKLTPAEEKRIAALVKQAAS